MSGVVLLIIVAFVVLGTASVFINDLYDKPTEENY